MTIQGVKINELLKKAGSQKHFARSAFVLQVLLLAAVTVTVSLQLRQNSLDASLIKAVQSLDAARAERLLNEGANPNVCDNAHPPQTIVTLLETLWSRLEKRTLASGGDKGSPLLISLLQDPRLIRAWLGRNVRTFETIALTLIQHGADVNVKGSHLKRPDEIEGRDFTCLISEASPLHLACLFQMRRTFLLLLSKGADTNARNGAGVTPLGFADTNTALLLIQSGATVNTQHCDGQTLLIRAVLGSNLEMVKLLIRFGADVNLAADDGHSPLYVAEHYKDMGKPEILATLRKQGARLNDAERGPNRKSNRH
jgi:hypothetical protein